MKPDTVIESVVEGLLTKDPPTRLKLGASPDLLNVFLTNGAAEKRGGFVPRTKDRMLGNTVGNTGYRATARLTTANASADGDFLIVPGCLTGGHRPIYEALPALTVECFFQVGKLTGQHGGSANPAASPYTISLIPILSKGPIKRTEETAGSLFNNGAITWNTTAATVWGNHSNSGMPFAVYIWNNGTGTAPVWQFRLSAHVFIAGVGNLKTVTSGEVPVEGGLYHIIAVVSGTRISLRIARIRGRETPSYTTNSDSSFSGTLAWNRCPIQVFDCPQQFIQAGTGASRPGLNLNAGGYWYQTKRAEGKIEDIAIWNSDKTLSVATTCDRLSKLNPSRMSGLINYWNMLGDGTDFVLEVTGRGNHLFFVPRGPVSDTASGGKDGGSWFFNGQTSYAMLDLNGDAVPSHINWRLQNNQTVAAAMNTMVRKAEPHGLAVDFWVDSIEPQFEQVIAEIHSVLRIAINTDGKIVGYCRDGDTGAASANHIGLNYQGPLVSNVTVKAGERYSVVLFRRDGSTTLDLFVGGVLDATVAVNAVGSTASFFDSYTPGGCTIGMGSYEHMIRGPSMDHASIALPNQLNTDARSGFVGRVESLKIVTTQAGATLSPLVKPETVDDWRFSEARTFQNPLAGGGGRNTWTPSDSSDTTRHDADGAALAAAGQHEDGSPVRHTVQDPASLSQAYITWQDSLDGTGAAAGRFGSDDVAGLGARLYHVLAYYRFNQDDRDLRYGGAYTKGLEWRYNAGTFNTATQVRDPVRHTHVQWSDVADATGALSIVQRRCHESDIISQTDSDIFTAPQNVTNRQRPYAFRSPREVGPQWRAGIVRPLAGQVPVSLIADWSVQTADRRFLIAATGRQLYWVKPLWEEDSPFNEEPNFAVWMQGWPSSHLFVKASASQLNLTGTASKSTIVFEGWLKPLRLDGVRMIAAKVTPATSQTQVSWCVYSNQGAIHVFGTESSGTRTWLYSESTIPGGATAPRLQHSLRSNVWNHLHVTIATAGVQVRVNGNLVDMTSHNGLTGTGKADAIGGGASDAPSGELYLGGLPEGRETLTQTFTAGASTNVVSFTPWAGYLTEVRILNAEDTAQWPTGQSGQPPGTRFVDTGTTYLLLHLNEGAGWFFRNSAANTTGSDAHSQVRECWPVMEGLEESSGHRYSWLIYRDRLLVSNGESRIQQLRFGALQDTNPITCTQLGMLPPEPIDTTVEGHTTVGTGVPPGTYLVAMTFTNADGTESEPIQLGSFVQAVAVSVLRLNLRRLPRSPDPQVTGRRLYASSPGGGAPLFNRQIDDNDGFEHDVIIYNGTEAVTSGDKVVPPRGRHLAVANASLLVADLTEEPAGQNAFAFGRSDEVSYFTVGSEVILDSFDGDAIIGARTNLGQVFISKARSVFQVSMGAIANANDVSGSVRLVNNSDGFGGGHCSSQNLIYGCGDRGVFVFDNANMVYLSQMIDRTWRQLAATTTIGLRNTYGLYNRNRSEVWISPRSETTEANNSILVLRLTGENAWSLLDVPEHSFMVVAQDDVRQQQVPLLGTTLGALLGYDDGTFIDHSDGGAMANGATTLVGSAGLSGSSTSLTMSGANFDTILGGLSGAEVEIVYNAGTLVRTIVRNTGDTLFWDEPLPGWVSFTSFTVGGYEGYWSSSWLSLARPSSENDIERIDLEMVPNAGVSGTLSITSIRQGEATDRAFPTDPAKFEQFVFDMSNGWLNTPEKPRSFAHGHYHRVKFGTRGIRAPFGLISVHFVGHKAMAAIGHAGKAS